MHCDYGHDTKESRRLHVGDGSTIFLCAHHYDEEKEARKRGGLDTPDWFSLIPQSCPDGHEFTIQLKPMTPPREDDTVTHEHCESAVHVQALHDLWQVFLKHEMDMPEAMESICRLICVICDSHGISTLPISFMVAKRVGDMSGETPLTLIKRILGEDDTPKDDESN